MIREQLPLSFPFGIRHFRSFLHVHAALRRNEKGHLRAPKNRKKKRWKTKNRDKAFVFSSLLLSFLSPHLDELKTSK